jgi:hypothetical protein
MPQLDIYMISSQIFWLLLKFNLLYVFMLETYILEFTKIFKLRYKLASQKENSELLAPEQQTFLQLFI